MRNDLDLTGHGDPGAVRDDASLVQQAMTSRAAFDELYRCYQPRIYRYLLTYASTPEDAADLTQHVFLRVLEALPSYRQQGIPFGAWLFRIARNAATDSYRRTRRSYSWEHVSEGNHPLAESELEGDAVQRESLNQLRVLVGQLDPLKQEMLALRFTGGLTSAEIGLVVGKSEAAVKKQLTRTLRSLQEAYRDQDA